jgi:4-hydroxy-3-polyprenylbenzoate decarboxylase
MSYKNIEEFISKLESENELIRVREFVDPILEISEITDRFSKEPNGGKALLFENTGTAFPVLTNSLGSYKRICLALGTDNLESFGSRIKELIDKLNSDKKSLFDKLKLIKPLHEVSNWLPRSVKGKGICQEIIDLNPDLFSLPVLKCWPADGGRFITLPIVHTVDPETGTRNVGMYRMQIFGPQTSGMHWHKHKTGARHFEGYKSQERKMPVAVALGGDPVYTYCATAPLPDHIDEYILAGFIRRKPVELVKCITQDIEVPSDVDFVIEGYVDPEEDLIEEGPFGDHTGFYSLKDWYPKFHVTCITHKKKAVYPATLVGIPPQEDAWIALATERIFVMPMKMSFAPEMTDINLPTAGVAHNMAIVKIQKRYTGQGFKVINSLWGAGQMMFNKVMVVTDEDCSLTDYHLTLKKVIHNIRIPEDILFSRGPLDVLDHASDIPAFGSKLGIDATSKSNNEGKSILEINSDNIAKVLKNNADIDSVNINFLKENIPLLFLTFSKQATLKPLEILKDNCKLPEMNGIKLIAGFDLDVNIQDSYIAVWQLLSNIDPVRDCFIFTQEAGLNSCLLVDATSKNFEIHNFKRPWPNITVTDRDTIETVDHKWHTLFAIDKIESPSKKYISMVKSKDAIAIKNNFK